VNDSSPLLRRAFLKIEELEARLRSGAARNEPLAIVGMGCRFPGGADSPERLWELLAAGRDVTGEIPADRWNIAQYFDPAPGVPGKIYATRGGFVRDVDRFDAAFFGISPREAVQLDPQQRLLLEVVWEALEHGGIAPHGLRGSRTGVYVGMATYDYAHLQIKSGDPAHCDAYFGTGTAASVASGRIAYTLGLHGPAISIDTACSSSLVALHLACRALRNGDCDLALVGGVNLILSPETVISMCQSRMMAPDGRCKTFDAAADGFGQAEGCAAVVVKRLSDAVREGDTIFSLIRGTAVNQDGASSGLTAPNGPAQQAVMRAALADAGLLPADVGYVEAHGAGTPLGDPIEVQALAAVFGEARPVDQPFWIGSIKTNLGHLEAAAGLAGLLKVVLSLRHGEIPAHLHFHTPNPLIPWSALPVRVADRRAPWPSGKRIAGLSSFGFSGTNAHILIEEAPRPAAQSGEGVERPLHLLTLSARSGQALRDLAERCQAHFREHPGESLADIAYSANTGRSPAEHRLAIIARDTAQAGAALAAFVAGRPDPSLRSAALDSLEPPRIAFLFTGEDAQGETRFEGEPVFRAEFERCGGGAFAFEWALLCLWRSWGIQPALAMGRGVGEYVAACASGVFSPEDAVRRIATPIEGPAPADPSITLLSSLTGRAVRKGERDYWRNPARGADGFAEGLRTAQTLGYRTFVEIGPKSAPPNLGADCVFLPSPRDWPGLLETLARLYLLGAPVDWAGFDRSRPRRKLPLPTYPFQRERFWFDARPARASALHPHLERRFDTAPGDVVFEARLDPSRHPYLADHVVHGETILPAAFYLEVIASAVREVSGEQSATLENVLLLEAVRLPSAGKDIQLILTPGSGEFRFFSRDEGAGWRQAVSGRFSTEPGGTNNVDGNAGQTVDVGAFYAACGGIGLEFGPSFQCLQSLSRRDNEAVGEVELPGCAGSPAGFGVHPAALDACLQILAAALPGFDPARLETEIYMPVGIDRFELLRPGGNRLTSRMRLDPRPDGAAETRTGHGIIEDAAGATVARISGLRMKRAPKAALARQATAPLDECFYEVRWEESPAAPCSGPAAFDWRRELAGLESRYAELAGRLSAGAELEPRLDAVCSAYALRALRKLGGNPRIVPRHRRLLRRLTEWLSEEPAPDPDREVSALLERFPAMRPEILFAQRGGARLAEVLLGEIDPGEILFPGGSFELADELYRASPAALVFNELAREAAARAVEHLSPGGPLRVLEIGAGTGGLTSAILPALPAGRTQYKFTDLSPAFFRKAADDFAAFPFLDFQALDIESPPRGQGFGEFDLVIASNVLHATADMGVALDHVRSLMAPGAQLLILEGVRTQRWMELSFGLTEGWWKFTDVALRGGSPLLSVPQWRELLVAKGFADPVVVPGGDAEHALILSRREQGEFLLFADSQGVAEQLQARLQARGARCTMVHPGEQVARGRDYDHIVFLSPVGCRVAPAGGASELDAQLERCCRALPDLPRTLGQRRQPRLWLVTAGAQAVTADDALEGLPQSAVWGLGKVIALEHPELRCVRIDLEPGSGVEDLLSELGQSGEEPQVAYRGGRRYVARLRRAKQPAAVETEPMQLTILKRGAPDGVALRPLRRRTPDAGQVEIEVRAAGLNFRDVLNVLGVREDEAPLGGEVSGVVSALGFGVEGLRAGDEVVAITSGGLGDYAVASAELVLPKPANLDFPAAAASPLAFLTAHYALNIIGRMAKGERVLIHAAAGGVGLAAVELARRAGAEVVATAGSPEKRDFLRSLGVAQVFDSRSPAFADEAEDIDLALNSLTGPAIAAGLRLLRPGGRFLEIGKAEILTAAEAAAINPRAEYHAIDLAGQIANDPKTVRPLFVELLGRLADGRLRPLPFTPFPLASSAEAIEYMARARHIGKVVLLPASSGLRLRADATYLVSGGLTGLGLAAAERLAERGARNLLLFGRRAPSAEASRALDTIRERGARVVVAQADVGCEAEMRALFEGPLGSLPPLRGVVHSAGRLEDAILIRQDWERFARVLAPKAAGAWLLHQMTADRPLDFFVLFSSASALLGAPGQANHAAANAFLDGLAHYRRARGLPSLSINWGAWAEIGAAAARNVGSRIGKQGIGELTPREGLDALERAMLGGKAQVCVLRADWSRLNATLGNPAEGRFFEHLAAPPKAEPARPEKGGRGLLLQRVRAQVAGVLGLPPGEAISDKQPLLDMGLDSLMAVELRNRLRAELKIERALPATLVFDHPSVAAVAEYLATEVYGWPPAKAAAPADVLGQIERMSEEDVEKMLSLRTGGPS